ELRELLMRSEHTTPVVNLVTIWLTAGWICLGHQRFVFWFSCRTGNSDLSPLSCPYFRVTAIQPADSLTSEWFPGY
ncbi:MAG: hypothetical protein QOF64_2206, partial [Candidatus Binatota bacterium]|nr:hypothetical protein [Candidatus Binatota bacterium]